MKLADDDEGDEDWHKLKTWQAKISATCNKLWITLMAMPMQMVFIDMESDIVFELMSNLLSLNGNVNIPWTRIRVQELP
ncbi:MAG: hypothetical protein ACTS73_04485 [Arsenophonus sp. NEOnobi-MAG3]